MMKQLMLGFNYKRLIEWVDDFDTTLNKASLHDSYLKEINDRLISFYLDFSPITKGVWRVPFILGMLSTEKALEFNNSEWIQLLKPAKHPDQKVNEFKLLCLLYTSPSPRDRG